MAKTFKVTFTLRLFNAMITVLLRLGFKINSMALLTVRGRKSGQPRTTPIALSEQDGLRWLISPYGNVNWVRNLRAAGEGIVTRGRRSERILAVELSAQEAAPLLKKSLAGAPAFLLDYFEVKPDSPLADFEREAPRHPVFLLKSSSEQANVSKQKSAREAKHSLS